MGGVPYLRAWRLTSRSVPLLSLHMDATEDTSPLHALCTPSSHRELRSPQFFICSVCTVSQWQKGQSCKHWRTWGCTNTSSLSCCFLPHLSAGPGGWLPLVSPRSPQELTDCWPSTTGSVPSVRTTLWSRPLPQRWQVNSAQSGEWIERMNRMNELES